MTIIVAGYVCPAIRKVVVKECPFCGKAHTHPIYHQLFKGERVEVDTECGHRYTIELRGALTFDECAHLLEGPLEPKKVFSTIELSAMTGISDGTLYYWIKNGNLKATKVHYKYLITEEGVVDFLNTFIKMMNSYTTYEFASLLNVTPATVLNWIKLGKLKAERIGSRYFIPKSELDRILQEGL